MLQQVQAGAGEQGGQGDAVPRVREALHRQVPPDRVHEVRPGAVPRLRPGAHRQVSPQELRRTQVITRHFSGELNIAS